MRAGPLKRSPSDALSEPKKPVSAMRGKSDARATPMRAFAATSRCSASTMSGRRSSRSEGSPSGNDGERRCAGVGDERHRVVRRSRAGCGRGATPARSPATVAPLLEHRKLRARRSDVGFELAQREIGDEAGIVALPLQLEVAACAPRSCGASRRPARRARAACSTTARSGSRARCAPSRARPASRAVRRARRARAAQPSPQIELVGDVERRAVGAALERHARRQRQRRALGRARAVAPAVASTLGQALRVRDAQQRARFVDARRRDRRGRGCWRGLRRPAARARDRRRASTSARRVAAWPCAGTSFHAAGSSTAGFAGQPATGIRRSTSNASAQKA